MAESFLYYHPTTRWLSRLIREERENCCDEAVSRNWVAPLDYAQALLALEKHRNQVTSPTPCRLSVAATDGNLMKRIEQIIGQSSTSDYRSSRRSQDGFSGSSRGLGAGLILAALGLVVGAAACMNAEQEDGPQYAQSNTASNTAVEIAWLPQQVSTHNDLIAAAARRHGIDPKLLAVMTLVESSGDPNAKSSHGARGLMQLMPETAENIARKRGQSTHTTAQLFDPEYNLDMAAYFIAEQFRNVAMTRAAETSVADRGGASKEAADDTEIEKIRLVAIGYNGGPEMLRMYLSGERELYAETARYQEVVAQLWLDRNAGASSTFERLQTRSKE